MFQKLELTSFVIDGVPPTTEQIEADKSRLERVLLNEKRLLLAVYGAIGLASVGGLVFVGFRLGMAASPLVIAFAFVAAFALFAYLVVDADVWAWELPVGIAAAGVGGVAFVIVGELWIVLAAVLMGGLAGKVVALMEERKAYVLEALEELEALGIGEGCRNERTV